MVRVSVIIHARRQRSLRHNSRCQPPAGNCQYEPPGTTPAYCPDLCDGYPGIRVVGAGLLARSRLAAAVLTGTLSRCRVYRAWPAARRHPVKPPERVMPTHPAGRQAKCCRFITVGCVATRPRPYLTAISAARSRPQEGADPIRFRRRMFGVGEVTVFLPELAL